VPRKCPLTTTAPRCPRSKPTDLSFHGPQSRFVLLPPSRAQKVSPLVAGEPPKFMIPMRATELVNDGPVFPHSSQRASASEPEQGAKARPVDQPGLLTVCLHRSTVFPPDARGASINEGGQV